MTAEAYFHGTKHPFTPGDVVVPAPHCIVDPHRDERPMLWATTDLDTAGRAARNRSCACDDPQSPGHEPRVFVVASAQWERDVNHYGDAPSVMARTMRIVDEVVLPQHRPSPRTPRA
ncbi:hypothetical protein [Nocardioides pakistanensis]